MKKIMVLATAGAGGDLQPLVAVTLGLVKRGHEIVVVGDQSVADALQSLGIRALTMPPAYDFGPRLIAAIRDGQGLEPTAQGELVLQRTEAWSNELAAAVAPLVREQEPDVVVTSLFGVGVAREACRPAGLPWCAINSTFYVGPNPPRDLDSDFSPRAAPLFRYFLPVLTEATLVLHATDRVFDSYHDHLTPTNHYVGPLIWEAPAPVPAYVGQAGDPWVLVTLSSQQQDDIDLAQAALQALAAQPVRVLLTIGPGHELSEIGAIPGNARVEQYVPHSRVLERAALLLSHAGHGSVMTALWYGVPMVRIPWGRDQPGVAARAEHLGAARIVARRGLSADGLAAAIQSALTDARLRDAARDASQRLRRQDPVAVACALLEQI